MMSLVPCAICGQGEPAHHGVCQDCAEKVVASYKPTTSGDFALWWSRYPHKRGKGQAQKAYSTARKKATQQELLDGVARYIANKPADCPWCNPATWLNGERWTDEYGTDSSPNVLGSNDLDRKHVAWFIRTGRWLSTWGDPPTEPTADPRVRRVYEEMRAEVLA